jgi:hypothetical protein
MVLHLSHALRLCHQRLATGGVCVSMFFPVVCVHVPWGLGEGVTPLLW